MPFSTDDFDNWNQGDSKPNASGASPNHPILSQVDTAGMPTFARLRLQEHVKKARVPFTSDLSVNELLLTRRVGYEPIAQVLGTSVYHVGRQWMPASMFMSDTELTVLTHSRLEAWSLAIERLTQQAHVAGADVVIGVRLERRAFGAGFGAAEKDNLSSDMIEVSLMGTAVRYAGQIRGAKPLASTISGQEFLALTAAGFYPVGVVFGCCVYYKASVMSMMQNSASPVAWGTQWQNQELTDYTNGFINARHLAISRLEDQAVVLGAHGILDMQITTAIEEVEHEYKDYQYINEYQRDRRQAGIIATVEAVGTAVMQVNPNANPPITANVPLMDS